MEKMRFSALPYRAAPVLAGLIWLTACAAPTSQTLATSAVTLHTVSTDISESAVVSRETQALSPAEWRRVVQTVPNAAYELGPDDEISVAVYMHPELSMPPPSANQGGGIGALITGDGTTNLPLLGTVHLGGMTIGEAQDALTADYATYVKSPNVTVGLKQAHGLTYYLLGAFPAPGVKYPLHDLSLLEALALGGGVDLANADLYQAYVAQGTTKLPIDLHALLVDGDLTQNITLAAGDTIVVPSAATENAFVFGAVGKPGAIGFENGSLSLLQALGGAGLDLASYTNARLAQVRVIRAHGKTAEFFVVDANAILGGKAAPFSLLPGDIVFVPPTLVATWNQVIAQLLPSLQATSAAFTPFVDIRYLQVTH